MKLKWRNLKGKYVLGFGPNIYKRTQVRGPILTSLRKTIKALEQFDRALNVTNKLIQALRSFSLYPEDKVSDLFKLGQAGIDGAKAGKDLRKVMNRILTDRMVAPINGPETIVAFGPNGQITPSESEPKNIEVRFMGKLDDMKIIPGFIIRERWESKDDKK